jgi:aspartate/methionine/tyrosine aminotransferase
MPFAIPFADRIEDLIRHVPDENPAWNELAPSANVRDAIEEALDRGETHYTDRPGILPLRERIAELLKRRFALEISAKNDVIVTCGMTEARFLVTQQVLQPGDTIAAPEFDEPLYGATILRRLQMTEAPGDARALYLTSSIPESKLRGYIEAAPSAAFLIYEVDEQGSRFHPAQLPGCQHRIMTLGTLGADSWSVGYLASPGVFSSGLRGFKQALTICTTSLSQWAVLAVLEQA